MQSRVSFFAFAALVIMASAAAAQEPAASLRGRVTDATGQGISAVTITARSPVLIRPLTTTTAATGEYFLASLPAGPYVIAFSRSELVPVKRTIRLSAAESAIAHVVLRPANGFDGAVTVLHERLVFPPSRALSLDTYANLQQLPVTGTLRSVFGLTTDSTGVGPSEGLFLFDGLPLRHGWQVESFAFGGPGPDAIREMTIAPAPLPADYGRTGTIALLTSPGGSRLAASVRTDLGSSGIGADLLRQSRLVNGPAGTLEYTFGGPVVRSSTWFFGAGRHVKESVGDDTAFGDLPFETETRERFGLGRLTHALSTDHRIEAQWVGARQRLANATPLGAFRVADTRALEMRALSDRALSAAYVGLVGRSLQLTARYTREDGASDVLAQAASAESLVDRTRLIDQQTGVTAWASGGCVSCDPRRVTHHTMRATAATLLPGKLKAHHVTVGVHVTRDTLEPTSRPPGGSFDLHATRFDSSSDGLFPIFEAGGSSWIAWSPNVDNRLRLRSDAFFMSDRWRAADFITIDLGLRFDRHRGTAAVNGQPVLAERGFSPRVAATWRPSARWPWTIDLAHGRYASSVLDRGLDASLAARPAERVFVYDGPAVNTNGPVISAPAAIGQVFDWFFTSGGAARPAAFAAAPGASTTAFGTVDPPRLDEWSAGASRVIGEDGYVRGDLTWRTYGRFSARRVVAGDPPAFDEFGLPVDAGHLVIDDRLERRYVGLSLTADYRFGHWADVGARYTISSLRGNAGESTFAGDVSSSTGLAYSEFAMPGWHLPVGALADDARHRSRVWLLSELFANEVRGTLMLSVLINTESGRPYGASGLINVASFMPNPGYQQVPIAARYYFTARDALRTEGLMRADIGLSYRRRLPGTVHGELFARFDVLNLTGRARVLHPERLTLVRTAFTEPSLSPFNPFTQTPVEGVHWTFDDSNVRQSTARESLAATMGRAFRIAFGIRF